MVACAGKVVLPPPGRLLAAVTGRPPNRRLRQKHFLGTAKDQRAVSTLRMITAKLKDTDIAARPGPPVDEAGIIAMLRGMAKSRAES